MNSELGCDIFHFISQSTGPMRAADSAPVPSADDIVSGNDEGLGVGRQYFLSALELSARQASLSWELRAATSLAIAEKSVGRKEAAWRTLQATHAKFREGLETVDLRLAKQVLNGSYWRDSAINSIH